MSFLYFHAIIFQDLSSVPDLLVNLFLRINDLFHVDLFLMKWHNDCFLCVSVSSFHSISA